MATSGWPFASCSVRRLPPRCCWAAWRCLLVVLFPFLGRAYFPRTDPGQFVINVHMPSGTRLEVSNDYIAKVENIIRSVVKPNDLGMIVSNIGVYPDLSAIYTTNASMDTAFVQTSLKEDHSIGSYEYMRRVQAKALRRRCRSLPPTFRPAAWWTASSTRACPRPSTSRSAPTTWTGPTHWPSNWPPRSRPCPTSAASTFRRTSIIPASRSTSTAKRPA